MQKLLKRLRTEEPSFVLDGEVAAAVGVQILTPPAYTASLDRARELIPQDFSYACGNLGERNEPWACVTSPDGIDFTCQSASTTAMALCVAALMARRT